MIALAIGVIYIPVLIVLIKTSRNFRRVYLDRANGSLISARMSKNAIATGSILSTALIFAICFLVPEKKHQLDLAALFIRIVLTWILPFVMGFFFIQLAHASRKEWDGTCVPIILNRLGIGAFHSIWLLPALFFLFVQIATIWSHS